MGQAPADPLRSAATIHVVRDVKRSAEYYRDALGFRIEFEYGEPTSYCGVERGNVLIHLQAASVGPRQPGQGAIYIFATGVDALFADFKARGARVLGEPKDYPYGMRDFEVEDLDGNRLTFGMDSRSSV